MRVVLGNRDARDLVALAREEAQRVHDADDDRYIPPDAEVDETAGTVRVSVPATGTRATLVDLPGDVTLASAFAIITAAGGVWAAHTHRPDATPAWVASDSDSLAALLADHFGVEVRELDAEQVAATFGGAP